MKKIVQKVFGITVAVAIGMALGFILFRWFPATNFVPLPYNTPFNEGLYNILVPDEWATWHFSQNSFNTDLGDGFFIRTRYDKVEVGTAGQPLVLEIQFFWSIRSATWYFYSPDGSWNDWGDFDTGKRKRFLVEQNGRSGVLFYEPVFLGLGKPKLYWIPLESPPVLQAT